MIALNRKHFPSSIDSMHSLLRHLWPDVPHMFLLPYGESFLKKLHLPFQVVKIQHPMVQKLCCERYLSIKSMLGKKKTKKIHFFPICRKTGQKICRIVGDKQSHFKVNDCTEQKTLPI